MTTLNAETRKSEEKNARIREAGNIPGIFYGFKKENTPIAVKKNDFIKVFKEVGETNTLTLETPDGNFDVIIHEVQHDPITNDPIHVDFLAVDMSKEIEVEVPFEFTGESEAVRNGGILVKVMHETTISALPSKVPHSIMVDISNLKTTEDVISLGDLKLPEGVSLVEDSENVVASISVAKDEPVESEAAPDLSTIEVEAKGKKEEESESKEDQAGD